jgi:hypothetical protein
VVVRFVDKGYHVIREGGKKPRWGLLGGEALEEYAREHGEEVFRHEFMFATLGDAVYVFRFNGEYWPHIDECGTLGPYGSLQEALGDKNCESHSLVQPTQASSSIWCSELSAEEIAKLLDAEGLDEEHHLSVGINGEVWRYDKSGKFKRVEDDEEIRRLKRQKWSLIFDIEPDDE